MDEIITQLIDEHGLETVLRTIAADCHKRSAALEERYNGSKLKMYKDSMDTWDERGRAVNRAAAVAAKKIAIAHIK